MMVCTGTHSDTLFHPILAHLLTQNSSENKPIGSLSLVADFPSVQLKGERGAKKVAI